MADERLVKSYEALEKLALAKMDDAERVQWYQQRTISAEQAVQELQAEKELNDVVAKFPGVKPAHLAGLKDKAQMEAVAAAVKTAIDESKTVGQTEVEEAVKEALKVKDTEIAEMRKAYGRPRTPQSGDVVGTQAQSQIDAKAAGLIPDQENDLSKFTGMERVSKEAEKAAQVMLDRLGLREK